MHSETTRNFWKKYYALPQDVQLRALRAYRQWRNEPNAHGLYFKLVNPKGPVYSVRIGLDYRALGVLRGDTITWYWIGHHDEYLRLI